MKGIFFFLFQMLEEKTDSLLDRHNACGKEVQGHEDYVQCRDRGQERFIFQLRDW